MQYVVFSPADSKLPALLAGNVTVTRTISRESIAMMLAADVVLIDASCGNDAWYVLGLLHGQHRRAVMIDHEMTRDSLAAVIANAVRPFPLFLQPCTANPFGTAFSCDAVHPSASTHKLIANKVRQAINAAPPAGYGTNIPVIP